MHKEYSERLIYIVIILPSFFTEERLEQNNFSQTYSNLYTETALAVISRDKY